MSIDNNKLKEGSAFYARTSTEEQRDNQTIGSQVEALRKGIEENKETLFKKYVDDGQSGAVLDRPALDELREDAKQGLFSKLYIFSPDRLARELYLQLVIVKEIRKYGVEIVFLSQKFGDDPASQLLFQMLGAISEFERAQILERTRRGKLHKARKNLVVGGIPPFGFSYIKRTETTFGRYEINQEEAKTVKLIFKLFNSPKTVGIRRLSSELYRLGVKTRSGKTKWSKSTLFRILTNQTYIGTTHFNKYFACEPLKENGGKKYNKKNRSRRLRPREEWIPISVPVIMSEREFEGVQLKLQKNRDLSDRNAKYEYLLRGLVYCVCGKRLYGYPCHGEPRYRCSDKVLSHPLPKKCLQGTVNTATLDSAVWQAFLDTLERPEVVASRINQMLVGKKGRKDTIEAQIKRIDGEVANIQHKEQRLLEAYAAGAISLNQLQDQNQAFKTGKESFLEQKRRLENESQTHNPKLEVGEVKAYFERIREKALNARFELQRNIIRLFAGEVIVGDGGVLIRAYLPAKLSQVSIESMLSGCCDRQQLQL